MIRVLLLQEFARKFAREFALVSTAALVWAGAKSLVFPWYGNDQAAQENFDGLLAAALFIVAASTGSSSFSRTFREGPLRLLEVLPVHRWWVWVVRVLTSLATALAGAGVFLLLDPAVLTRHPAETVTLMTGFGLLLFAAGCSLSAIVNASGTVVTGLAGGLGFAMLFTMVAAEEYAAGGGVVTIKGLISGAALAWILTPILLGLSLVVFMRGELDNPRRRWANRALGAGAALAGILLSAAAMDARVFEAQSGWQIDYEAYFRASPDGSRVATVQTSGKYTLTHRIVIIDTASGNTLTTYESNRLAGFNWAADGAFIAYNRASVLSYLLNLGKESFAAIRIFPTEELFPGRKGFRYINSVRDRHGSLVLAHSLSWLGTDSQTVLLRMENSGQTQELLRLPEPVHASGTYLSETVDGNLLTTTSGRWWIREDIKELPSNQDWEEATARLAQSRGLPPASQGGKFLRADSVLGFGEPTWLYYLQPDTATGTARLWAKRNDATEWKEVVEGIPLSPEHAADLSPRRPGFFTRVNHLAARADATLGVVAHLSTTSNQTRLLLFDLNSGERFDLGDMSAIPGPGPLRVEFHWRADLRGSGSGVPIGGGTLPAGRLLLPPWQRTARALE